MRYIVRQRSNTGAKYLSFYRAGKKSISLSPHIEHAQVFDTLAAAKPARDAVLKPWNTVDLLAVQELKNTVRKMEVTADVIRAAT